MLKTLKTENRKGQFANSRLNDNYWLFGLYKDDAKKEDVLKVFEDMTHYRIFHYNMQKRLDNEMKKYGYTDREELQKAIVNNGFLRNTFATDSVHQGYSVKIQERILRKVAQTLREEFPDYEISLENNFENYCYLISHESKIIKYNTIDRDDKKMFDIPFSYVLTIGHNFHYYPIFITCRCTNYKGGTQDAIFREILTTYQDCSMNKDERLRFAFILDGTYWDNERDLLETSEKVIVSDSETFIDQLRPIIRKLH
jgi:hypothetical protein